MLIHSFVVSPVDMMSNNQHITLPRLLSPLWLDGVAAEPTGMTELPGRPPSVAPYHLDAPEAACVLLRSMSSRPFKVVTVENGSPSSLSILRPGDLSAVWVVERDTELPRYVEDDEEDLMEWKMVTPARARSRVLRQDIR
eukprot:CAMPEP_0114427020 /NCGR_PEP_ID=MMETSP0103-20121206/8116_1 /TAXON_ID=37642 ORGANISM="Paraphysomonas imperforata, Strain PA2" /NCGR_SAMPLE_ID=MMETSP0103 /ASSEMBLY_ACC=CAM_ASM_000201 /LENGTH=139 /DNA_ID=CAMNT_0001596035 /DNA_START=362 /DNA_END=782 /DNA_ORIENTATION=-